MRKPWHIELIMTVLLILRECLFPELETLTNFFYFLCTLVYFLRYLSTKIDKYLLLSTDPPQILQTILYRYYRFYQLNMPGKRRQKYKTK